MRALLEKDIRILLLRKSTMVIFLAIGILFTWSFSEYFSGVYLTILGSMLAYSTISYDESDNCMAFLFTLPCTRKQYVVEKFVFVYGVSVVAGLVGLVISIVSGIVGKAAIGKTGVIEILASEILILTLAGSLMIPLQLKFGAEKSRIVLVSIYGVCLIGVFLASKSAIFGGLVYRIKNLLDNSSPIAMLIVLLAVLIIITLLSILATIRIMEGKEY